MNTPLFALFLCTIVCAVGNEPAVPVAVPSNQAANSAGTSVARAESGRIETELRFSSRLVPSRRVDVWLPPGYDTGGSGAYPVLYMHDGQNLFDPSNGYGGGCWEVDQAMCRLIQTGKTRGAIIVGVWSTGMGRFPEYMPRKAVRGDKVVFLEGFPSAPVGDISSDLYLKFLVSELKPWIDHRYRTLPDKTHTFVMGSSMGGLISGYALVEYPEVFGAAGCVSTHWPADAGSSVEYFSAHLPKPGGNRVYFDYGTATLDAQYEPYQQRMDQAMRAAGYTEGKDWVTRKYPGAEHSEPAWRDRVEIPLRFFLGID